MAAIVATLDQLETALAIFKLQVAPIRPTKFRVNLPFGSGEEAQNISSWWTSWISDQNDLIYMSSRYSLRSIESVGPGV